MKKIKAIRKVIDNFQSVGTRFFIGDLVLINGNEICHVFNKPGKESPLSAYRYESVGNSQIEKIMDNSQDEE